MVQSRDWLSNIAAEEAEEQWLSKITGTVEGGVSLGFSSCVLRDCSMFLGAAFPGFKSLPFIDTHFESNEVEVNECPGFASTHQ